jgi:DNA adenine methylase
MYVEPFGGGASVLLRKERAYAEIYNDVDGDVVNLFRVLREPETCKELKRMLQLTPFAREEFTGAYEVATDPVEAGRRMIIRSFMGFGSAATNPEHKTGFRANSNRSGTTPAHDWVNYPKGLDSLCERLRGVTIENRDALQVMLAHDGPDTLHYVDPPYVLSTRNSLRKNGCYRHEMTDADHETLAGTLDDLDGMVVLSGYPCELYDRLYAGWHRAKRARRKSVLPCRTSARMPTVPLTIRLT